MFRNYRTLTLALLLALGTMSASSRTALEAPVRPAAPVAATAVDAAASAERVVPAYTWYDGR